MSRKAPTIELFYSYAHADEPMRKKLEKHLATLHQQGLIASWHDRMIGTGTEWEQQIDEHLNRAQIILLLISANFLASPYCSGIEMKRAMERHKANEARVIPVILRPVHWKDVPFAKLQMLPTDGKPIASSHWHNQDEAFTNVAVGIRKVIDELNVAPEDIGTLVNMPLPSRTQTSPSTPIIWNVPYRRNPFFTGREDVLQQLHEYFAQATTAALTQPPAITGLGGIGKTQVAVEYAYRYKEAYHSVLWVNATSRETLIEGFVTIARLLSLPAKDEQDQSIIVVAVQQWLATHSNWLLILDNADDSQLVTEFLPTGNTGHLLLTTREQAWGVIARNFIVKKMDETEGILFLLRRANVLKSPLAPISEASSAEQTTAAAIVKEMDGLPLALDQAGAYIEETPSTLDAYLKAYQRRQTELLHERGKDQQYQHKSVATTWSLNFEQVEQLNPTAADLLRFLAFLAPDAIPEEMIVAGASELGPQFQALVTDETLLDQPIKWAERTVRAVNLAYPDVSNVNLWAQCERVLPHALTCAKLIEDYTLALPEAARLLKQTGYYLIDHAQYEQAKPLYERALAIRGRCLASTIRIPLAASTTWQHSTKARATMSKQSPSMNML